MSGRKKTSSVRPAGIILILLSVAVVALFLFLQDTFNEGSPSSPFMRGELLFNEVMSSNDISYADEKGNFYDWVEIHNSYGRDVDLSGYTLSMGVNDAGWTFPSHTVISAEGYLVLWFSGVEAEGLTLPYKIDKAGGEKLYLRDKNGSLVDMITVPKLEPDTVYYRTTDGVWDVSEDITPGFENSENGRVAYLNSFSSLKDIVVINEICTRNLFGPYSEDGELYDWIEIVNISDKPVVLDGYYLSDDEEDPRKWQLPSLTLGKGEYFIVYLSGKDGYYGKELHGDFKLSNSSGTVILSDPRLVPVTKAIYGQPEDGAVLVRENAEYRSSLYQTPGFPNTDSGYEAYLKRTNESSGLIINEIMLLNDSLIPTDGGRYYDWVELYNASSSPIDLSDYWLSDNEKDIYKCQLPSYIIGAGEYKIVYLSGEVGASTSAVAHTSFSLDNGKEPLILSDKNGICDVAVFEAMPYGYSLGRVKGEKGFFYIETPTPLGKNGAGKRFISAMPFADTLQGVYEGVETLSVSLLGNGTVRYTTDGSDPDESSPVFTEAVTLDKTTVIRAVSYEEGKVPSSVVTLSYIINEGHTFPVMSLVTDPDNLWSDEIGIYAMGPNAAEEHPYDGANFYENWERSANISLFEDGGTTFALDCGVKIFGQSSRSRDKKSFQLKFKEKYGTDYLRCEVFADRPGITRYDTLVLRSGAQDYNRATFRDELFTNLVGESDMDLITQAYRPCVLYLNGEYWGIYFIREKIDEDYISQNLNVSPESVTILRGNSQVVYGDNDEYIGFYYYAKKLDMTVAKNYNYVCSKIDIDSFIDYYIAQAYLGNRDVTNVKFYKTTEGDGKWRWILFDLDYAFDYMYTGHSYTLYNLIKEEGTGYMNKINNELIRALLKNEDFLHRFLTRYGYWLNTVFTDENVLSSIDEMVDLVAPEQDRNAKRWDFKMSTYRWYVSDIKDFVDDGVYNRQQLLMAEAQSLFDLTDEQVQMYFYPEEYAVLHPEWEGVEI